MKVETVVDEHRARYIHRSESSSDPNATGYFRWIFPTGRIQLSRQFLIHSAQCAPSPSLATDLATNCCETSPLVVSASPFREKPTTTRFIHVLFNRLEYHLTSSYLRPSSFLPSLSLRSFVPSDRDELFRRGGEEGSLEYRNRTCLRLSRI